MIKEEVLSIHHSVLHWAHQCSTGSSKCLFIWWFVCAIWKQNTILRRNNIVLNVKFHFAGELRGFAHCVCDFWFVCRVLRVWGMLSENVCKQSRKTVRTSLPARVLPPLSFKVKFGLAGCSAGTSKENFPFAKLSRSEARMVWITWWRWTEEIQRN